MGISNETRAIRYHIFLAVTSIALICLRDSILKTREAFFRKSPNITDNNAHPANVNTMKPLIPNEDPTSSPTTLPTGSESLQAPKIMPMTDANRKSIEIIKLSGRDNIDILRFLKCVTFQTTIEKAIAAEIIIKTIEPIKQTELRYRSHCNIQVENHHD